MVGTSTGPALVAASASSTLSLTGLTEKPDSEIMTLSDTIEHDLHHQFMQAKIPLHCMAVLAEAGFTSSKLFRFFGVDQTEVKEGAIQMGLDPKASLRDRGIIARLQGVWSNTASYEIAEEKDRAQKLTLGITPASKPSDYTAVRKQYEHLPGNKKQKKRLLPGNTVLDSMEAELVTGEFKAPRLIEIPSKEEVERAEEQRTDAHGVQVFPVLTASGVIRMTQSVKVKVPPIEEPESYRSRMDLLAAAVEFTKIKNPNHKVLATADKEMWADHKDYILGDMVRLHEVEEEDGSIAVSRPSWQLVMSYDYKVRAKAADLMSGEEGPVRDMKTAFTMARECRETRRDFFLDKLCLEKIKNLSRPISKPPSQNILENCPVSKQ